MNDSSVPSRRTALAALISIVASGRGIAADSALGDGLRRGDLVLIMRHAKSPREEPGPNLVQPDNPTFERQLDAEGRAAARDMGRAITAMKINVSAILTSPTYRGRETARLIAAGQPTTVRELGDGGRGMDPVTEGERVEALRRIAQTPPAAGSIVIAVTHLPNITGAFGASYGDMAEGESLVLRPDGKGGTVPVSRIKIAEWPALAGS